MSKGIDSRKSYLEYRFHLNPTRLIPPFISHTEFVLALRPYHVLVGGNPPNIPISGLSYPLDWTDRSFDWLETAPRMVTIRRSFRPPVKLLRLAMA